MKSILHVARSTSQCVVQRFCIKDGYVPSTVRNPKRLNGKMILGTDTPVLHPFRLSSSRSRTPQPAPLSPETWPRWTEERTRVRFTIWMGNAKRDTNLLLVKCIDIDLETKRGWRHLVEWRLQWAFTIRLAMQGCIRSSLCRCPGGGGWGLVFVVFVGASEADLEAVSLCGFALGVRLSAMIWLDEGTHLML